MIGTLIAIIIALLLDFSSIGRETTPNLTAMGIIIVAAATLFLFLPSLAIAFSWSPLQKAEQNLTPHVIDLYLKDNHLRLLNIILLLFPLVSFAIAIDILFLDLVNKNVMLSAWIILLGISLDALRQLMRRISSYLDPFYVVTYFTHEANKSIQNDRQVDLCNWIDSLSEVAMRSVQRSSTSLCIQVNDELQHIFRLYLQSSKSISHRSVQDQKTKALGIEDWASYTLFFLLQRLEMINTKASEMRLEPICSNIVTVMGKIIIDAAKYDISMPGYPLHFIGKFAVAAQNKGLQDVGPKAVLTLLEVAKTILAEIDVTYAELQEPFFSLISQMNEITKEMFRQDKTLSIKLLTQPFHDLKDLFKSEKMANHQDTPAILQKIDGVLAEYDALENVMRAVPPIPAPIIAEKSS